jgi:hypothetical protein
MRGLQRKLRGLTFFAIREPRLASALISLLNADGPFPSSNHPQPYGHPHSMVMNIFNSRWCVGRFASCVPGIRLLRTDQNLDFTVWTDGISIELQSSPPC